LISRRIFFFFTGLRIFMMHFWLLATHTPCSAWFGWYNSWNAGTQVCVAAASNATAGVCCCAAAFSSL
jgi:hypothetical protein